MPSLPSSAPSSEPLPSIIPSGMPSSDPLKQKNKKKSEIDREEKKKNISTLESDESKNIILSDQKILADLQRETKDILIRNRSDGRNQKSKRCSFKWDGIDSSSFILPRKSISKQKSILRRPKNCFDIAKKIATIIKVSCVTEQCELSCSI